MKINLIIVILIVIIAIYVFFDCRQTKEKMADVSNSTKDAIREIYNADVQAIRNLSEVATKLQQGGLTHPGNLNVKGMIDIAVGQSNEYNNLKLGDGGGKLYLGAGSGYGSILYTTPDNKTKSQIVMYDNQINMKNNVKIDGATEIIGATTIGGATTINNELRVNKLCIGNVCLVQGDGNSLRIQNGNGFVDVGAQNSNWAHIYTDRPKFALNKQITDVSKEPYSDYIKHNDKIGIGLTGNGKYLQGNLDIKYAPAYFAATNYAGPWETLSIHKL
jgi:uncharacterized protein YneF (UPF0154 family)